MGEHALQLLQRMTQENITPTAVTYDAAVTACSKGAQLQWSLELLHGMQTEAWRMPLLRAESLGRRFPRLEHRALNAATQARRDDEFGPTECGAEASPEDNKVFGVP